MLDDDMAMFMSEMSDVKPLVSHVAKTAENGHEQTLAQQQRRKTLEMSETLLKLTLDVNSVKAVAPEEVISFKREGVQQAVFDRLCSGGYKVASEVDLHQLKLELAREVLFQSIEQARQLGQRSILVIHGKGSRSKPIPALMKSFVATWLVEIDAVLAYHSAQIHHGGNGAAYVMLTKSEQKRVETREENHKGAHQR